MELNLIKAGLETFCTIFTDWFLGWRQTENSLIFILSGSSATLSYILITIFASKRLLSDRQILLIGLVMNILMAHVLVGTVASLTTFRASWLTPSLCISIMLICIG